MVPSQQNPVQIKALFIGMFSLMLCHVLLGVVIAMILGWQTYFAVGMQLEEMSKIAELIMKSEDFLIAHQMFEVFSSLLGGYVAARIATTHQRLNAGLVGSFGITLALGNIGLIPVWIVMVGALLAIPMSLFGARLAMADIARKRAKK